MDNGEECFKCGGNRFASGSIQANGKCAFYADNPKFFTTKTADVNLDVKACLNCGFVQLIADKEKLNHLTKKTERFFVALG